MSKLPQRRKSAEEIAKLRESIGVPPAGEEGARSRPPGPPPVSSPAPPPPSPLPSEPRQAEEKEEKPPAPPPKRKIPELPGGQKPTTEPSPKSGGAESAKQLASSGPLPTSPQEPAPVVSPDSSVPSAPADSSASEAAPRSSADSEEPVTKLPAPMPPPERLPSPADMARRGKPVRSLKKSERMPPPPKEENAGSRKKHGDSKLPAHRHDIRELQGIRARNAMQVRPPVEQIKSLAAHPAIIILGYLLAFAGGAGGLAIAAYLFLKKPRSHHHAAFIAIIAVLVLVFGTLYFFPVIPNPDAP